MSKLGKMLLVAGANVGADAAGGGVTAAAAEGAERVALGAGLGGALPRSPITAARTTSNTAAAEQSQATLRTVSLPFNIDCRGKL